MDVWKVNYFEDLSLHRKSGGFESMIHSLMIYISATDLCLQRKYYAAVCPTFVTEHVFTYLPKVSLRTFAWWFYLSASNTSLLAASIHTQWL